MAGEEGTQDRRTLFDVISQGEKVVVTWHSPALRRFVHCGYISRAEFEGDHDVLATRFGGGLYRLYAVKGKDYVGDGYDYAVDEDTFGPHRSQYEAPKPPTPEPGQEPVTLDAVQKMVTEAVTAAVKANTPAAPVLTPMAQLKELAEVMKAIQPTAAAAAGVGPDLKTFMEGVAFGRGIAGFDWNRGLDRITEIGEKTLDRLLPFSANGGGNGGAKKQNGNGNGGGNGNGHEVKTEEIPVAVRLLVGQVLSQARAGVSPDAAAQYLIPMIPPAYYEEFEKMLARTDLFETLCVVDAALKEYGDWFAALVKAITPVVKAAVEQIKGTTAPAG